MTYRWEFILEHGQGPYECHFCGESVVYERPWLHHADAFVIHHLDWDRSNNALDNLVPTHSRCHQDHHTVERAKGRKGVRSKNRRAEQAAQLLHDPTSEQWKAEEEAWIALHPEAGAIARYRIDEVLAVLMIVHSVADEIRDRGETADLVLMDYIVNAAQMLRALAAGDDWP
jgi:hypothetical protein